MIRAGELNEIARVSEEAGRLLAFALTPKTRPTLPVYGELLKRFQTDPMLRVITEAVASGLGLRVLDTGEHGLVLGAQEDSPFALRIADYRQNLSAEERMCHGLIQLAVAAWCFPNAQDLDDPHRPIVTVSTLQLVRYLVELCQKLKQQSNQDPEFANTELREAWRILLSRPETRETQDSRRSAQTLGGMIGYALDTLEREGMLRRSSDENGGTYRTLSAYRVQVRELGAHEAFRWIQETRRRCAGLDTVRKEER
jgi:hypothetical protein